MTAKQSAATSDLRHLACSVGLYAATALAQRGLGFLLIPVYTRLIEPTEYGILELLNSFSSITFLCLTVGLASAINKCYHRDCRSESEKASVLPTAILIDLPILLAGSALLLAIATPISRWLVGTAGLERMLWLVIISGVFVALNALTLATLRAQERTRAFAVLTLVQFVTGLLLNLVLVVVHGLGIRGVLWANLLSNAAALPIALLAASWRTPITLSPRLIRPLLHFGILLIPVMLSGWVMNLSDRYILRLYRQLDEVAVYGVGYKFGMVVEMAVVWPFQLAWPAFSFAISSRAGHQVTYARALTYLTLLLAFSVLLLSLLSRGFLSFIVGEKYGGADRIVLPVTLAYACNGIQYAVSPGVHIAGKTRYLSVIAIGAAIVNVIFSFLLIPRFGMLGAAWSTVATFLLMAVATGIFSQRVYPVPYEYARLGKIVVTALLVYLAATSVTPVSPSFSLAWHAGMPLVAFPALVIATGLLDDSERALVGGLFRRRVPVAGHG